MTFLLSFFVSAAAGIAAYYICKRLDWHIHGKEQEARPSKV